MTSVLTVLEGGRKLLPLRQKLLVAFNIHGTIAEISSSRPVMLRPRPYLSYLFHTLSRLQCDVHFITSLNPTTEGPAVESFLQQHAGRALFPYHVHYETPSTYVSSYITPSSSSSSSFRSFHRPHGSAASTRGSPSMGKKAPICRHSFTPVLLRRALAIGSTSDHMFCVDTEVNYRFPPLQTIVLEPYTHYTQREKRKAYQAYIAQEVHQQQQRSWRTTRQHESSATSGGTMNRSSMDANGKKPLGVVMGTKGNRFVDHHEETRQRMAAQEAFLKEQQPYSTSSSSPVLPSKQDEEKNEPIATETGGTTTNVGSEEVAAPPTTGSKVSASSSSSSSFTASRSVSPRVDPTRTETGLVAYQAPLPSSLLQDYICVALATFLTELSAGSPSSTTVKGFLQKEPILEPLRVPMHGTCFYLAKENCQDLEMVDWNEVEVVEQTHEEDEKKRTSAAMGPSVRSEKSEKEDDLFFQ